MTREAIQTLMNLTLEALDEARAGIAMAETDAERFAHQIRAQALQQALAALHEAHNDQTTARH
jgi:hypothetical protein